MLISTTAMLYKLINCSVLRHSSGNCNNNLAIETLQIAGFQEIKGSLWNARIRDIRNNCAVCGFQCL